MEYHLVIKKKKTLLSVTTIIWIDLEGIMLSEKVRQRKTNTISWYHGMISFICGILKKKKPHRYREQIDSSLGTKGQEVGKMGEDS